MFAELAFNIKDDIQLVKSKTVTNIHLAILSYKIDIALSACCVLKPIDKLFAPFLTIIMWRNRCYLHFIDCPQLLSSVPLQLLDKKRLEIEVKISYPQEI